MVETVGSVSHALEAQEAEIRVNTPEFEPLVSADSVLMGQVFTSIIYNAIEALDYGGGITIDFARTAGCGGLDHG